MVHWQDLPKEDKEKNIDNRIKVSGEIFASCLAKANAIIKNEFNKSSSTVWHDGDKQRAIDVAKLIFASAISYEDVKRISEDVPTPEIEDIKVTQQSEGGKEAAIDEIVGGF